MPRMTTCRSRLSLALLAMVVTGVPPVATAQQPVRPATHTVQRGDTLWDLARRYLGDPFLWPQIYRLNTDVVRDPHWIYPGDLLRLAPTGETRAVPEEPVPADPGQPAPAGAQPAAAMPAPAEGGWPETEGLFPRRRSVDASAAFEAYRDRSYRPLRAGEFYSSGFLTEGDALPFGTLLGNVAPPQIPAVSQRSFTLLNDKVAVRAPEGARYAVGDSLLVLRLRPGPSGTHDWGEIVHPTGVLVVTGHDEQRAIAEVRAIFGDIRDGQLVIPAERFIPGGEQRAEAVRDGVSGRIIMARETFPMRHPMDVVFLDVGRRDGVGRGDIFEVWREPTGAPADRTTEEVMATMQVVHVRERTATARIVSVVAPDFPPRALVRQMARLPR